MKRTRHWLTLAFYSFLVSALFSTAVNATLVSGISLSNILRIAGNSTDLYSPGSNGVNVNRLGVFFSELYYERHHNVYYGLADRGPGGSTISYNTRVQ